MFRRETIGDEEDLRVCGLRNACKKTPVSSATVSANCAPFAFTDRIAKVTIELLPAKAARQPAARVTDAATQNELEFRKAAVND